MGVAALDGGARVDGNHRCRRCHELVDLVLSKGRRQIRVWNHACTRPARDLVLATWLRDLNDLRGCCAGPRGTWTTWARIVQRASLDHDSRRVDPEGREIAHDCLVR